ncbi:VWA domain-containing protein [Nocardioides caeni]|uniref:VWA domain-containing protein n=1 Tax=Nocardioides caeni TaxID=574700 RepID=UPI001305300A|nr:VWA domain-containing protein [Nocardioides caeni]
MIGPVAATGLTIARRVAIVLAFVAVLLRPGLGEAESPVQLSDLDVLVVLDVTRSMAALDHQAGEDKEARITGAKADLADLAAALPGARFGMVTFGAEGRLTVPFTTDAAAFLAAVETTYLERPRDGAGSRADRGASETTAVLARAEEQRPERRRIVVYVGDGEDTSEEGADQTFEDAADLVADGVVLGYGTEDGAAMPASDDLDDSEGYVEDPETGSTAISRADFDNLQAIAHELGVPYVHRTSSGGIDDIAEDFESSYVDGEGGRDDRPAEHDLTWVAGLVLLALVLLELRAGWRSTWRAHRTLDDRGPAGRAKGARA